MSNIIILLVKIRLVYIYGENKGEKMKDLKTITKQQVRRFLLLKHGLLGDYKFSKKQGIIDYIRQSGCIQYDPIDVCGKNHELVLATRIKGFSKLMLYELLYKDRMLMDWFDKNMAICLTSDWPYFEHHRSSIRENSRSKNKIDEVSQMILDYIKDNGPVSSSDIDLKDKVDWGWAPTSLARAALDTLYMRGDLILHHKRNTRKYYDLSVKHIDSMLLSKANPNKTVDDILIWNMLRRIESVGMLHNNNSYAFIGIGGLSANKRNDVYKSLYDKKIILKVEVEGVKHPFYYKSSDDKIMDRAVSDETFMHRLEFLAPLDNMLWDRKIIKELFGFKYKWEIYTPIKDRKYGYYVLPILYGENLVGRIEMVRNKAAKSIEIKNIWFEDEDYNILLDDIKKKVNEHSLIMYEKLNISNPA